MTCIAHISSQADNHGRQVFDSLGSHLGVGRNFGARHELVLRVEHFSNAGIKHPNPGENFAQLRYTYRFQ